MNRLIEYTVRVGFVTACRLAGSPTSVSPFSVNATTLGVSRLPSAFAITFGSEPSMIATTEFVVPRSMPMIFSPAAMIVFPQLTSMCVIAPRAPQAKLQQAGAASDCLSHSERRDTQRQSLCPLPAPHATAPQLHKMQSLTRLAASDRAVPVITVPEP